MNEFPANPKDGTVAEVRRGLCYIYDASIKSWIKVTGSGQLWPLATPVSDGVMSAVDLKKINRVIIPTPSSTIKGENCDSRFISGHISMYSSDDYLKITGQPLIKNAGVGGNYSFRITQNTAGFDFTIDKQLLINDLVTKGQINLIGPQGPTGLKGVDGNPGITLPTGPQGPKGETGSSPPCSVSITPDPAPAKIKTGTNKAVVALTTQQISETEYVLIASRGVVGNPDAGPSTVNAKCGSQSTWLLAMPTTSGNTQQVYYVDIATIIAAIQEKFESELVRIKQGHEETVQFWLEKMSELFYAQKSILCCAITKCAAANGGSLSLLPQSIISQSAPDEIQPIISINKLAQPKEQDNTLTVDGLINVGSSKQAATIDLPAGLYVVEIIDCCIMSGQEYIGDVKVTYNNANNRHSVQFVRPGKYTNRQIALRSYNGLTLEINHDGGPIEAYMPSSLLHDTSGSVTLRFMKKEPVAVAGPPHISCTVTADHLAEYEQAWHIGKCCGFMTRVAGQDYIIVKRSIGNDETCGGGEDPGFDCILKFQILYGHPALAWPTLDNKTFVKIAKDKFIFKMDNNLTDMIVQNLNEGLYVSPVGCDRNSIAKQFTNIIFPIL